MDAGLISVCNVSSATHTMYRHATAIRIAPGSRIAIDSFSVIRTIFTRSWREMTREVPVISWNTRNGQDSDMFVSDERIRHAIDKDIVTRYTLLLGLQFSSSN
jgi:D-arabinose 1-dehydrogenase-like Zn-dependent alcohol dehydrogenase